MLIKILYFVFCTAGLISAFLILTSINPLSRLIFLIIVFIKSAFIYLLLDFYFLGLTYIIVYVGAIAILFLFVIMMSSTVETPKDSSRSFNLKTLKGSYMLNSSSYTSKMCELRLLNYNSQHLSSPFSGQSNKPILIKLFVAACLLLFNPEGFIMATPSLHIFDVDSKVAHDFYNYYFTSYTEDFIYITDLLNFGLILYLAYPYITVLFGILLWIVLIGILIISSN